ncbi:Vitamin B12 import ATP-binding protein BtuD [Streptomyces glaucescens]
MLLEVRDLHVEFRTRDGIARAVNGVTYRVDAGETLAVLGESGSGKSVTAQAVMGILDMPPGRITGGEILFQGRDLLKLKESERREVRGAGMAMIFQDALSSLNPVLTVGDQLGEMFVVHRGMSRKDARAKAVELMDRVRIPGAKERVRQYPHQFSGGMRQRIMIAMAMALEPALIIADEPTTALDVTVQAQVMDLLAELRREYRMGLILITHDLGVVADVADRIAVMYAGKIVESAPVHDIYKAPAHPYTRGLLDSVPRLDQGPGAVVEGNREVLGIAFPRRATARVCRARPRPPRRSPGRRALRGQMGVVGGDDARAVGAAVGVEEHRQGRVTGVVPWHKHGARNSSCAPLGEVHARGHTGVFRVRRDDRGLLPVPQHPHHRSRPLQCRRHQHGHLAGPHRRVHPGLLRQALDTQLVDPVDMHLTGLRPFRFRTGGGRDQHVVGRDVEHRSDVQLRSGQRSFTHRQHACAALVGDPHQLPGGRPARHPREKIQPNRIFVGVHHPGRPGVRVHGQVQLAALVPRLDQEQRRTRR